MCGIAGILRWHGPPPGEAEIAAMTAAVAHRGPDGQGVLVRDRVAFGHRRLAIIDPAGGQQPLANEDETVWVTYNGEIYNFHELHDELVKCGHTFRTRCDTEVVVHAYEQWGAECVRRFRGMFAFGLVDFRARRMLLARDHFGIKPLYYWEQDGALAFASELPALQRVQTGRLEGNLAALEHYLRLSYVPGPQTVYRNVWKLPPATYMEVDFDGRRTAPQRYWDLRFATNGGPAGGDWSAEAEAVIRESVRAHLVSDVPFGVFLSGGTDSTLVALLMQQLLEQPVQAFAIGFAEAEFSELKYAEEAARRIGCALHTEVVSDQALAQLPELAAHYGEPFGDSSAIPTWHVARLARQFVPMVLSGDGGDEAFGGYDNYARWMAPHYWRQSAERLREGALRGALRAAYRGVQERLGRPTGDRVHAWQRHHYYLSDAERMALWRPDCRALVTEPCTAFEEADARAGDCDRLAYAQFVDYQTYLPGDILPKVDVASMYHGLEVRTPLVDLRVVEFAARLPARERLDARDGARAIRKRPLKRVLEKTFAPEFVHRVKQGFAVPRANWFEPGRGARVLLEQTALDPQARMNELLSPAALRQHLDLHDRGTDKSHVLWLLLCLGLWLEQNRAVTFN